MRCDGLSTEALPVEFVATDSTGAYVLGLSNLTVTITRPGHSYGTQALVEADAQYYPGLYHLAAGFTPDVDATYTLAYAQTGAASVVGLPVTQTTVVGPLVGSATLGANLVDSFVPMVDSLRGSLNAAFGVRQYRTRICRFAWLGGEQGRGALHCTYRLELLPAPAFTLADTHALTPGGLQEVGSATLAEVSLSYTQSDLGYADLPKGEAVVYLVTDALGQGIQRRTYLPGEHPESHRADDKDAAGWVIQLRRDDARNVTAPWGQP